MVKQIVYTRAALRTLLKMHANTAKPIRSKVSDYAADPASQANNVKKLHGGRAIRLRVCDWRVIMEDDVILEVQNIGPRGSVYD